MSVQQGQPEGFRKPVSFYTKPGLACGTDQHNEGKGTITLLLWGGVRREKLLLRLGLLQNKSTMERHPLFYDL